MTYLIHGHAVEQEKIVRPLAAMDIKPRHEFRPCIYAGKILQCLYNVGRTQKDVSEYEIQFFQPLVTSLTAGRFSCSPVRGNLCLDYTVPFLGDSQRIPRRSRSTDGGTERNYSSCAP